MFYKSCLFIVIFYVKIWLVKNSWKFKMHHSFGIDCLIRWARYKTANTRSNIDDFILILNLHKFKDFNMHFLLGRCDCATSCNTKTFAANVATSSTQDPRSSDQCSWQKQKNTIALGMYNIKKLWSFTTCILGKTVINRQCLAFSFVYAIV